MKFKTTLIIICIAFLFSCKKENNTSNPDIVHQNLNLKISATSFLFDTAVLINFDNNASNDFFLRMRYSTLRGVSHDLFFASDDSRNQWLVYEDGEDAIASLLAENTTIDSTSDIWGSSGILYRKYLTLINFTDAVGAGDIIVGVRFIMDTEYHYAWIKLSVSSDFKTVTVKEYAYRKTPDKAIKAGEY
jgi:hypothetical protein